MRPVRCQRSVAAPNTTQTPSATPTGPSAERPVCIANANPASATASTTTPQSGRIARLSDPRFHASMAPGGNITASATMKGVKAASKKGAPTESVRPKAISEKSGQIVPVKTTNAATASRILFITSALSRLTMEKAPFASIAPARAA